MPFRNAGQYISEAMESLVTQTYARLEVIAIDDGSSDDGAVIVERVAARDSRVRLISEGPRGFVPSLNRGLKLARGEFVARMDADDVCLPDRIARQVAFLDGRPDIGAVGGQILTVLDGTTRTPPFWIDNPLEHDAIVTMLKSRNALHHPTTLLRRDIVIAAGAYRSAFTVVQDYDLWLRLAERTRLANLPDRVLRYRFHDAQATERNTELAFLCTWSARHAAAERAAGRPDPIRVDTVIDRAQVAQWGLDPSKIDAEISWIRASHRARGHLLSGRRVRAFGAVVALVFSRPGPFLRRVRLAIRASSARRRGTATNTTVANAESPQTAWPASR